MIRLDISLIMLAALAMPWVAARAADPGVTDHEIVLGSCAALQGAAQSLGKNETGAAQAYIDYINHEKGGVNGRMIRLIVYNDDYVPDLTVDCFNKLVKDDHIFAGGFFVGTPSAVKVLRMADAYKVPVLGFVSGGSFLYVPVNHYVFNTRVSNEAEVASLIEPMWNQLGLRKIAVIYTNDALGASIAQGAKTAMASLGGQLVGLASFSFDPKTYKTSDVNDAVERIRQLNPDGIIVGMAGEPARDTYLRIRGAGMSALVAAPIRDPAIMQAGKAVDGLVEDQVVPLPERTSLPTVALYHQLLKKYAPDLRPNPIGLEGFVHAVILVEGLKRAGPDLTRESFIRGLESMSDEEIGLGPTFKVTFGPNDHQAFEKNITTYLKDGKNVEFTDWTKIPR